MAIDLSAKKEELAKSMSNLSKTLVPGSQPCTITGITYRVNDYKNQDGLNISLQLEGKDLTDQGFEGFFLDQSNPDLGRHKGAVGRVELSQFSYISKEGVKNGKSYSIDRNFAILIDISKVAAACGKFDELMQGKVEEITDFIDKASEMLKGSTLNFVIAGKEYEKNGYTQYNLYIPKAPKGTVAFEMVDKEESKLMEFNPNTMIARRAVPVAVDTFEPVNTYFDTTGM